MGFPLISLWTMHRNSRPSSLPWYVPTWVSCSSRRLHTILRQMWRQKCRTKTIVARLRHSVSENEPIWNPYVPPLTHAHNKQVPRSPMCTPVPLVLTKTVSGTDYHIASICQGDRRDNEPDNGTFPGSRTKATASYVLTIK